MDAPEQDRDRYIQKYSSDLVSDFDRSLASFLTKPNGQLRRRVRNRETARLTSHVLEPFQELPQLLDPQLPKWLPSLAGAYLGCLRDHRNYRSLSTRSQLLLPLSNAICQILYSFCKIRGEKVIVMFLNVETKYLELLLLAIEDSERETDSANSWTWHERYIVLLWLSQLFFAPFDLSTISSGDADDLDRSIVPGFEWPSQIPGITLRVIPLAIKYLASPGKERDGAKALLVRVAMRKDMQELGILNALVKWALSTLNPSKDQPVESPYYYIGTLSFLAGILSASADTSIMDPYLSAIFNATQSIDTEENAAFDVIKESALARKMLIKVMRSVVTLVLRKTEQTASDTEMVEISISYLLGRLADNDTPVRLAASKALSIITLKLEPEMASEVVEAILGTLNQNVLWVKNKSNPSAPPTKDITAVDPLEWHGLMLTLSHLLYQRSPPAENLSDIIHALLMGLSFEKRNPSGGSIGSNVRDASCFGIWALARRYSTSELLQVQTKSILVARGHDPTASILQVVATELVVTASLDPAGNIRRGASAALQELIGRHPDTVEKGISVVQTVDYHAVALRSRAIHEVALQATRLSPHYGRALLEATLGWRGIGDMDAGARRVAASSFGNLTAEVIKVETSNPTERFKESIDLLLSRLRALQVRQVEERHGLLLSLATVLDLLPLLPNESLRDTPITEICAALKEILQDAKTKTYRKPELIAEATAGLAVSGAPALLLNVTRGESRLENLQSGPFIVDEANSAALRSVAEFLDTLQVDRPKQLDEILAILQDNLNTWLDRSESEVVKASSKAALILLLFAHRQQCMQIIETWANKVRHTPATRSKHGDGFFHALSGAYQLQQYRHDQSEGVLVGNVLAERWNSDNYIETRVAILQSLVGRSILKDRALDFLDIVSGGLDDYTTTARGDIGSHVRLEAIKATKTLWDAKRDDEQVISVLFPRILRLASEKLDRVRIVAQSVLATLLESRHAKIFSGLSFSSKDYFDFLLRLCNAERLDQGIVKVWTPDEEDCISILLAGLVTSADTGNEDLVIVSRAALADFCVDSSENLKRICAALVHNLKVYQGQDRIVIPTLEVVAYLFHAGLLQLCPEINLRQLCVLVQKAAYKTGSVRKLEACIRVYGAIAAVDVNDQVAGEMVTKRREGVLEAKKRLGALMTHPWPRARCLVVDELWSLTDEYENAEMRKLLTVDWSKAEKSYVKKVVGELGLE
ncbi:tubulin folding cofactor D C terminal-domain-containing protein [Annulohypoxylon maeteangense]|uniref:tubulin folding cofactor D C terminal-domain-containing protein n=1 Tax=Annulohypoxylon maeteangense TaxID=1927788 RepID=UPI0020089056|nr:tubulin folding cofactor D C terminal-domain-containing protein [Annulohypoxylon maeteangense]KAI0888880.1 tubulin folding cofactor D C terminal-domain-containing protein [Annulohypoxylon maeteangense]